MAGTSVSRRKPDPMAEVNLLDLKPVRVAEWEEADGQVVILRPPPRTTGFRRLVDRLLVEMSTRRIRLDEVGSAAWLLFDGERTVGDVADELRARFGDAVEPAEERVGTLVRLLHRQLFVEFPGIDD